MRSAKDNVAASPAADVSIPHDAEAERAVLGAALFDQASRDVVLAAVTEDDLYDPRHQAILRAVRTCAEAGSPTELPAVIGLLGGMNSRTLEHIGGFSYLSQLVQDACIEGSLPWYCKRIRETAALRGIRVAATLALSEVSTLPDLAFDAREIGDRLSARIDSALGADASGTDLVTLSDAVASAAVRLRARQERGETTVGLPTGTPELDRKLGASARAN